jgi:hypothetical protein
MSAVSPRTTKSKAFLETYMLPVSAIHDQRRYYSELDLTGQDSDDESYSSATHCVGC